MGYGGKPIALPRPGDPNVPGALYVARCRFGYGDTARTAGGASDGCHVWADTQVGDATSDGIPLFRIAAVDSDAMAPASDVATGGRQYGGLLVWGIQSIVKTQFTASVDLQVYDTNAADTTQAWLHETQIACTAAASKLGPTGSDMDTGFGWSAGMGPRIFNTSDVQDIYVESTGADIAAGIIDFYIVYSYTDMDPLPGTDWPDTLEG